MRRRPEDYVRVRAKLRATPCGCWVNPPMGGHAVNQDDQPVVRVQGRTVAVRTWLRWWFGVRTDHLEPCDTPRCLLPIHQPPRAARKPATVPI